MAVYHKYHVESGHIIMKIVVSEDEKLKEYAEEGYDFIDGDLADLANHYVKDGLLEKREKIETGGNRILAIDDSFNIPLPEDSWVKVNDVLFVATGEDGFVDVTKKSEGKMNVEIVGKYFSRSWDFVWVSLDELKNRLKLLVDTQTEIKRNELHSIGVGQSITYLRKADAARSYINGDTISQYQAQRLENDANRLGITKMAAAENIVKKADDWEQQDADLDRVRLDTKALIDASLVGEDANKAFYDNGFI